MKIIAGLGNPGKKYLFTRHNAGFMLIDALAGQGPFQKKHESLFRQTRLEGEPLLLVKPQTFMNRSGQALRQWVRFYKIPLENLLVIHDDKDLRFGRMKFQKSRGDGGHNGIRSVHKELGSRDFHRLKIGIAPIVSFKGKKPVSEKERGEASVRKTSIWRRLFLSGRGGNRPLASISPTKKPAKRNTDCQQGEAPVTGHSPLLKDTAGFVLAPFSSWERGRLSLVLEKGAEAVRLFIAKGGSEAANRFNSIELFPSD